MKLNQGLTFRYEKKKLREGYGFVIGCDEVGRGCLAGPVVASAVALDFRMKIRDLRGIKDSKLLSAKQREKFDGIIRQNCVGVGIGIVDHKTIDKINIHRASLLAMRKAVENLFESVSSETLDSNPGYKEKIFLPNEVAKELEKMLLVIDGKFTIPEFHMKQEAVVDGDAKIFSVAAASIVAKVFRDNLMGKLHKKYPGYRFNEHKGYATFHHREAIKKFGLSPYHRISFCNKITQPIG